MFCNKCGAQLPDTASFCNKCGNTVKERVNKGYKPTTKISNFIPQKSGRKLSRIKMAKGSLGLLLMLAVVIIAVAVIMCIKNKQSIYGTWTDSSETMTFSFEESGILRISGANNVLGADVFQFAEDKGILHLQAELMLVDTVSIDLEYEVRDDILYINFRGKDMTLYRVKEPAGTGNVVENFVEEAMDTVQIISLYGTWSDSYGAVSFTFYEDGKVRITGLEDILDVDAFTFTEVDDDTLQLKADTNNVFIDAVGINMDYEINGNAMTVSIAGKNFQLIKND